MEGADDCNSKAATTETMDQDALLSQEEAKPKQLETKVDLKKASTGDEEIMEDSPIMGVLTPKSETGTNGSSLSESKIEEAIWARAGHFQANSEKLTLAGVRRLLEEDLGLDKNTLDPYKKFISRLIDQVLSSPKGTKSAKDVKKKASVEVKSKTSKKASSEEESDASRSESDENEDNVKSKKGSAPRRNIKKLKQPKKRKFSEKTDLDVSGEKQNKHVKRQKQEDNNSDEDGSVSEGGESQSSVGKTAQRKEKSAPGYGKQVENLKSIIKACGMSVAPVIYKKAKQVPDDKREAFIVKELEGILTREGLSKNPSEKEIKDCRKRKETARELEGIDMSNIISSSRRRSTFSFVAPEKPIRAKRDNVDARVSKKGDKNDNKHNDDNEEAEKKDEEEEKKEEDEGKEKEEDDDEEKKDKEKSDEEEEVEEEVEDEDEDDDEEEDDEDESEDFNEDDNEESD